ncbi:MAG: carboxymuconolactone decarboxylase family protein [Dehalococcoidia bacterium]
MTAAERLAVRYAELLAANHTAIDQALIDELLAHYTERQLLELGWAAAAFIGFGRLIHTFGCRPLPAG